MRRLSVTAVISLSLAVTVPALADERPRLRPSVAFCGAGLYPSKAGQLQANSEAAIQIDASLEFGPVFLAGTWLHGVEDKRPDHSFLGVKLGYVLGAWPLSPFASVGIGNLSQTAVFAFDNGTQGSASGLAYEFEVGAVLLRGAELGRLWIYGLALFPTFDVQCLQCVFDGGSARIHVFGFGLRVGL